MKRIAIVFGVLAACGPTPKSHVDAGRADARPRDGAVDGDLLDAGPDSSAPYRHTIAIDGVDDFTAQETIVTTSSPAYAARVTWDATTLYIGYSGPDLDPAALDASTKWLFVYVDVDPGAATGATESVLYNTQHATFPTGFGAELYARWKCDASFRSVETYAGATWSPSAIDSFGHAGSFVELAIPRSALGSATTIGVTAWMINEKADFEGSFAGLYAGNFTDGYAMTLPLTKYLRVDFDSPNAPSDPANQAP